MKLQTTRYLGWLIALASLAAPAHAATPSPSCALIVSEHWPPATASNPAKLAQARKRLFGEIGVLLDAAYKNGGYVRNPVSFPVRHTDFRDDLFLVDFRASCPRARMYLYELLQGYRNLPPVKQRRAAGPDLVIEDRTVTDREARSDWTKQAGPAH
jgi:hypothetical protein